MPDAIEPTHALHLGDNREVMPRLAAPCAHCIVTDPPYEHAGGFMGHAWDRSGIAYSVNMWRECKRLIPPGGHLLAFGGCKTHHRVACAIEDAGFEIRDNIADYIDTDWLVGAFFDSLSDEQKGAFATIIEQSSLSGFLQWVFGSGVSKGLNVGKHAEEWSGWHSQLKPGYEPIIMARKPLDGTIVNNVLTHGVGAINIDACRVETSEKIQPFGTPLKSSGGILNKTNEPAAMFVQHPLGRFPSNVIHDGSDEVLEAFAAFGGKTSGKPGVMRGGVNNSKAYGAESRQPGTQMTGFGDTGTAARFFYSAKASPSERDGNPHPTVKPVSLMRWCVRLVCPPGGTVLDPFAGSFSTGEACVLEGMNFIGIEKEQEYYDFGTGRMERARARVEAAQREAARQGRLEL